MGMKMKITTTIPMFVERKTTKKMVPEKIITENKGAKGPTVMETDGRMQEIWAKLLLSWREGVRTWRWKGRTKVDP
jgi:hypothetical protein